MSPEAAFEKALADMQAASAADMAAHERKRRDTRLTYLSDVVRKLDKPITGRGFAGFVQVIEATSADSSRNWRLARVKSLMAARRQQLDTDPRSTRFWLAKAAEQHRKEVFCRHREQAEANLEALCEALKWQRAWVNHWIRDVVEFDTKPTPESLTNALAKINAALETSNVQ